jgi:exodeoxyribonuclease VIII
MNNKDYHLRPEISASMLKTANKSMAHYWEEYVNPDHESEDKSRFMEIGTAFHTLFLEPDRFNEVCTVVPEGIDKRSKDGKALFAEIESSGKIALKPDEMKMIKGMAISALKHKSSWRFFDSNIKGLVEQSYFWEQDGIKFKMRPDYEIPPCPEFPTGAILDLKSAAESSTVGFSRMAYNAGYYIQDAHYSVGFMHKYGTTELPDFYFIAVEKEAPYVTHWFKSDSQFVEHGLSVRTYLIEQIVESSRTGIYRGYNDDGITILELPAWLKRQLENESETIEGIEYV